MGKNWTSRDHIETVRAEHDDQHDAKRVVIVAGEALNITANVDTETLGEKLSQSLKEILTSEKAAPEKVIQYQVFEVEKPFIVEKIEYKEIEKTVIVEKVIYKEIEKPIIVEKIVYEKLATPETKAFLYLQIACIVELILIATLIIKG